MDGRLEHEQAEGDAEARAAADDLGSVISTVLAQSDEAQQEPAAARRDTWSYLGNERRAVPTPEQVIVALTKLVEAARIASTGNRQPPMLHRDGLRLRDIERAALERTLELTGYNQSAAARILGISRPTLLRKLRSYRAADAAARTVSRKTPGKAAG